MADLALLADVGGTNARVTLVAPGGSEMTVVERRCDDFENLEAVLADALDALDGKPTRAALALAGPVEDDVVRLTNRPWTVSAAAMKRRFGLDDCRLVNDFAAVAWSLPHLGDDDLEMFGDGEAAERGRGAMAVLGPGTGLGVGAAVPSSDGWSIVAAEGGHVGFAPSDHFEASLLQHVWKTQLVVSREDLLSGPGLARLHLAMAALGDVEPVGDQPAAIVSAARDDPDGLAAQTVRAFCRMLGGYAGDLALIYGAWGGVFLAGGVIGRLGGLFDAAGFRERFVAKAPMQDRLALVPTFKIIHPYPALRGLSAYLDRA
ncbi:MAG: glucokinase [Alphaproteobacteria bacterium]